MLTIHNAVHHIPAKKKRWKRENADTKYPFFSTLSSKEKTEEYKKKPGQSPTAPPKRTTALQSTSELPCKLTYLSTSYLRLEHNRLLELSGFGV